VSVPNPAVLDLAFERTTAQVEKIAGVPRKHLDLVIYSCN